jgi:hypothetical protein
VDPVRTYQVYAQRGEFVADTNDAVAGLLRVAGARKGTYLVTDKQGPRSSSTVRSPRHDTGGVLNREKCEQVLAAIGPRRVGDQLPRPEFGTVERVTHIDVGARSRVPGSLWSVTVVDEHGARRVHADAWTEHAAVGAARRWSW